MPANQSNYLRHCNSRTEPTNDLPSMTVPGLSLSVLEIDQLQRLKRPLDGLVTVRQARFDEPNDEHLPLHFDRLDVFEKMDVLGVLHGEAIQRVIAASAPSDPPPPNPGDVVDGG